MATIRIFLADDHTVVRDGLRALLESQPDLRVVGDAADGRQTVSQVQRLHPEVVVMDIAMPELNGIEAARQIRETCPATRVIMLSMHSTLEHIFQAWQAGAQGYVLKEAAGSEVIDAIRAVSTGRRYLSQKIPRTLVEGYAEPQQPAGAKSPLRPLQRLSAREREVLQLVAEGRSSAEIAACLFLSAKTVETYRSRLMRKLGLENLPSLIRFAVEHGLTPLK